MLYLGLLLASMTMPFGTTADNGGGPTEKGASMKRVLIDFQKNANTWQIIDDGVMGGMSKGHWEEGDGVGVFSGTLSLENNGGFSSVRSGKIAASAAGASAFQILVKGDGRTYQFRIRSSTAFDGASYMVEFPTHAGTWEEITVPIDDFKASFRGRILKDHPPLHGEDVVTLGFLLADKNPGPFRLEIARVDAVVAPEP